MEPSPFVRNSFWTLTIGNLGNWLAYLAINAGSTQKCLAMPSLQKVKRAMWWSAIGITFVHGSTVLMGMVLYARYHGCDPFATGEIKKTGQMLPLFVTEVTSNYPGLAGLFVSGVLSAALSSMSSSINTMAGTLYEDIVEFIYRGKKQSEAKQSFIMKVITLLLGLLCVLLVLLVEKTDSIFQMGMSLAGITNGALMTLFVLGLFIPRANSKGAIAGALSSLAVMSWLVGRTQYFFATGELKYPSKHTSVDLCPFNYTGDLEVMSRLETYRGYGTPVVADPSVALIYRLSYMHYTLLGSLVGVVVGVLVSLATTPPPISARDRHLFSPVVQRFLPRARPKSNSVRFAEEEFKLVNVAGEVTTEEKNDVPPKEDIQKPE
ncbi:sodium-coupled monocarboxylate transporter 1-like [Homalodisca vitripennis]|uniref:sodium-coupled monocarboxylate transporter 1-like n=1 Tax=Homalodisca vitripennis TaxID=197043 RepID=UPI001EE9B303|nr:sodium-coupled monocarboxylate transporter 1-like [Homalodisca vitripennis]